MPKCLDAEEHEFTDKDKIKELEDALAWTEIQRVHESKVNAILAEENQKLRKQADEYKELTRKLISLQR